MISPITVRIILEAAKIEEVVAEFLALRRSGASLVAPCPFHHEKTPSFSVSPVRNAFKCFGCGKADEPKPAQPQAEATDNSPKGCLCQNLLIGYFEMEDCITYLPTESPFDGQGYDLLEIAWNFEQHRVIFRSTDYRFCEAPAELWVYDGEPIPDRCLVVRGNGLRGVPRL